MIKKYKFMGFSLLIDATSKYSFFYLIQDKRKVILFKKYENQQDLSYKLMDYLNQLLKQKQLKIEALEAIYLVYGPGKFSAMRICATIIKTINLIKQIPIYIIDKFDYLSEPNSICVIKSDGKKSFICQYNQDNEKFDDVRLIDDQNVKYQAKGYELISDLTNYYLDFDKIIKKLNKFINVDYHFVLDYLKAPC